MPKHRSQKDSAPLRPETDFDLFRQCVDRMEIGVGILDRSGRVTYANDKLAAMLGYAQKDMLGQPIMAFLDPDAAKVMADQLTLQEAEEREPYELTWTRKDGSRVSTIISPRPNFARDGSFIGSFATVVDVTNHKRIEDELSKANEKLVREVADRRHCLLYT